MTQPLYTSLGHSIPPHRFGPLNERSNLINDGESLRAALTTDGYLLLRDVLDPHEVLTARKEVFSRLVEVGELKPPAIEGIQLASAVARSCIQTLARSGDPCVKGRRYPSRYAFRPYDCDDGANFRRPRAFVRFPVAARDGAGPRVCVPLRPCVYEPSATDCLYTVWTALGDVPIEDGPMLLVEGSHRWDDFDRGISRLRRGQRQEQAGTHHDESG